MNRRIWVLRPLQLRKYPPGPPDNKTEKKMQEEEFCLEALKKTQEEEYPVFKPAILSGFQIAAHKVKHQCLF